MKRNKNITVYFLVKILSNGHVLEDSLHNQALYNNFPYCSRNKYLTGHLQQEELVWDCHLLH